MEDMLEDCNTGVAWVLRHIGSRGGDPSQIYMVGQSAGGQLGALLLIAQVSRKYSVLAFLLSAGCFYALLRDDPAAGKAALVWGCLRKLRSLGLWMAWKVQAGVVRDRGHKLWRYLIIS